MLAILAWVTVQAVDAKKCKWMESKSACKARWLAFDAAQIAHDQATVLPLCLLASVAMLSATAYFHRPGRTVGALKLLMPRHDGPNWQSSLREHLESTSVISAVTLLIAVDISCSLFVMLSKLEALEGVLTDTLIEHAESIG